MIKFDRFGWRFAGASSAALDGISLRIRRGDFVTVAGPSGSGKTTLALAMCGLLVGRHAGEARGSVEVGGEDVAATPLHQISQKIGLVQQNPETHFATLTVSDELAFGMENRCLGREEIRRRSAEALELLSITSLGDRRLATLSGGEKQRVAVASIVAGKPDALILDEPTASLDAQASCDLFHALADLCRRTGLTVVIIEHKLAHLLPLEPRLICLEEGRVVADAAGDAVGDIGLSWLTGPGSEAVDESVTVSSSPAAVPLVDVSRVTIERGGRTVLRDVSLQVRPGETVAVLGPNGGGKSTLLHALLGLVPPISGSIRVCGQVVPDAAVSKLARRVGLVFQNADHQLVADTVWNEALFAVRNLKIKEPEGESEATRLLDLAGLSARKPDHPYRLSWGQKRRLNLISAILHRPRLLLLDEPFAGQDWENTAFLLDIIRGAVRGIPESAEAQTGSEASGLRGACLMVTHDPRIVARGCTRVLFVSGGRVIVDAPVPEAFRRLVEMGHKAYVLGAEGQPATVGSPLGPDHRSSPD